MPRSKDTFSPQTNLPISFKPRLEALAAHREQSISAAIGDAVRDAILRFEAGDTKDAKLDRIEAKVDNLERQNEMLQAEKWTQIAAPNGRVQVAIKLDDSDMDRLVQAVKARG